LGREISKNAAHQTHHCLTHFLGNLTRRIYGRAYKYVDDCSCERERAAGNTKTRHVFVYRRTKVRLLVWLVDEDANCTTSIETE
jgi:hypothetical protein